jgi:hypothetical protein
MRVLNVMKLFPFTPRAPRSLLYGAETAAPLNRYLKNIAGAASSVLLLPLSPLFPIKPAGADPIVVIQDKGSPAAASSTKKVTAPPFDPRRTNWIAELERTRNRIKRRTGIDLDIELAKSLCRSGSLDRCEEAVARLQEQVTAISASASLATTPPTPPSPGSPPQSNTSVIILTEPRHRRHPHPTYPPPVWGTPRFAEPLIPPEFAVPENNLASPQNKIPSGAGLLPID